MDPYVVEDVLVNLSVRPLMGIATDAMHGVAVVEAFVAFGVVVAQKEEANEIKILLTIAGLGVFLVLTWLD